MRAWYEKLRGSLGLYSNAIFSDGNSEASARIASVIHSRSRS